MDMVVAEGLEAGGHNGRDETTTLVLTPAVVDAVKIPVITAGGIGSGRSMAAALALGAEGVQVGSRFIATPESSAHQAFKSLIQSLGEGATELTLKELAPVRMIKNEFFDQVRDAYSQGASIEDLKTLLGRGRAKAGMFEGDMTAGELEVGQISALIQDIQPAGDIVAEMVQEYQRVKAQLP